MAKETSKKQPSIADIPQIAIDLFQPWNTTLNVTLLSITYFLARQFGLVWVLFYPVVLFLNEICMMIFHRTLVDASEAIESGYNFGRWLDDSGSATGDGLDYGFNFYDGDYTKSRSQAQEDKFEFAYKQLGLKPGMKLMDCGCGCGDWILWLKTKKGIDVHGVNITSTQVKICRDRGLVVEHVDWKDIAADDKLCKKLHGKFDAVTFWDTVEHYVPMHYNRQYDKQNAIYQDMFRMAQQCLRPDSDLRRIWISCLHHNIASCKVRMNLASMKSWTWGQFFHRMYYFWLLDKFHSGCYPGAKTDQLVSNAAKVGVELIGRKDTTLDYYKTSEINPSHFGKLKFKMTLSKFFVISLNVVMDPSWFPRLLWLWNEGWMCQFDDKSISESDMQHWWLWFNA